MPRIMFKAATSKTLYSDLSDFVRCIVKMDDANSGISSLCSLIEGSNNDPGKSSFKIRSSKSTSFS